MLRRLHHLIWKEFIQVLRDKKLRLFIFLPPIIQLIAYGYAINFDIKHVPMAIYAKPNKAGDHVWQLPYDMTGAFAKSLELSQAAAKTTELLRP